MPPLGGQRRGFTVRTFLGRTGRYVIYGPVGALNRSADRFFIICSEKENRCARRASGNFSTSAPDCGHQPRAERGHRGLQPELASSYRLRSPERIGAFFDGLTLVPPGLVPASRWRAQDSAGEPAEGDDTMAAVGRKP
jgi:hypothetical protein